MLGTLRGSLEVHELLEGLLAGQGIAKKGELRDTI